MNPHPLVDHGCPRCKARRLVRQLTTHQVDPLTHPSITAHATAADIVLWLTKSHVLPLSTQLAIVSALTHMQDTPTHADADKPRSEGSCCE